MRRGDGGPYCPASPQARAGTAPKTPASLRGGAAVVEVASVVKDDDRSSRRPPADFRFALRLEEVVACQDVYERHERDQHDHGPTHPRERPVVPTEGEIKPDQHDCDGMQEAKQQLNDFLPHDHTLSLLQHGFRPERDCRASSSPGRSRRPPPISPSVAAHNGASGEGGPDRSVPSRPSGCTRGQHPHCQPRKTKRGKSSRSILMPVGRLS